MFVQDQTTQKIFLITCHRKYFCMIDYYSFTCQSEHRNNPNFPLCTAHIFPMWLSSTWNLQSLQLGVGLLDRISLYFLWAEVQFCRNLAQSFKFKIGMFGFTKNVLPSLEMVYQSILASYFKKIEQLVCVCVCVCVVCVCVCVC